MGIPFPALALNGRLGRMSEMHSWASHLPDAFLSDDPSPETLLLSSPAPSQDFPSLTGRVWSLSRDPVGCRDVQFALESAKADEDRTIIASELQGHIREAIRCPHANHVIQKCITTMAPLAFQFIIDELMEGPAIFQAVRHKYGCRIVQRLLEHALSAQVHNIAEAILSDVYWIARHPYGNFVMQHLLERGGRDHRHRICRAICHDVAGLGKDTHGRAVISSAMACAAREDQVTVARAVFREPGLLVCMARTRHGHHAAKCVAEVLEGRDLEDAKRLLQAESAGGPKFGSYVPKHPYPKKRITQAVAGRNGYT
mmetsp:Transcript_77319/g.226746  ORF Transcript_77319/g.226746 Transcript_77319/m.226746 type:complete len:313 (-) Transcript_77319:209-1147(-)